ncbi:hypothetical protein SAMN05421776_108232 [Nocardia farcinica]|uniref:Uncharacterized protein n=1 Tax=Nocardia farcinica TaxID=37329 RepID=A0A0H5NDF0_NOCFR|nr:hypothetical protein [Nocardia farcinica]AXK88837.1 hypothetical protein DXT66_27295 [Nocardia farcinica]MBA4858059.1 hypothetical protein [Nocardia farcinica]MBC9819410.1 hypothetical protein [Nocardia farcinica]MBF6410977.1 hypothetical protein [Nocardia farcinica]PFX04044.1 hypothetical protein CJ469_01918 [Nocardia farcinica]
MSTPSIGRIVHFQTYGTPGGEHASEPTAAIITGVHDHDGTSQHPETRVDLFVIYPNGTSHKRAVPFSETPKAGHWSWPPRV